LTLAAKMVSSRTILPIPISEHRPPPGGFCVSKASPMPEPISNATVAVGGLSVMGILSGLLKWLMNREVKRIDATLELHDEAIRDMQQDRVRRSDLERIGDRFDAAANRIADRLDAKLDAVHRRIDQFTGNRAE